MPTDDASPDPLDWDPLFDVGRLPGTGPKLWGQAVEQQLITVVKLNRAHRRRHAPGPTLRPEDPDLPSVLDRLHVNAYYLVMAIKRVLRFTTSLGKMTGDRSVFALRDKFLSQFPSFELIRDYYEHLDEYTLGEGKHQKGANPRLVGPIAPVLVSSWDNDDLHVRLGGETLHLTHAAWCAKELAEKAEAKYEEHMARSRPEANEPAEDDERPHQLVVKSSITSQVGRDHEFHIQTTTLRRVYVRPSTPEEIERARQRGEIDENGRPID